MSQTNGGNLGAPLAANVQEAIRDSALEQLERILTSSHFRTSKRCSQFLRYVVEHSGNDPVELKERTLGVEVFNRDANYDTHQDPVVRITAGEVRKRLAQYYQETGHDGELRITLPAGSYVPEFHQTAVVVEPEPVALTEVVTPAVVTRSNPRRWMLGGALAGVVVVAGLLWTIGRSTGLDDFWSPVIAPAGPVLVCMGQPNAYHFQTQTQGDLDRWFNASPEGSSPPENLKSVPLSEFVPSWDKYVSIHDTESFARLSSLFASKEKQATIRGARMVSLADLRGRPVVLIGAFNNDWTLSLGRELRFYFDVEKGTGQVIRDRQDAANLEWRAPRSWPFRKIPMDYALVTRVVSPVTESTVVMMAGLTHFGTQAAGEFVTNSTYFRDALKNAPADWRQRNMQVVLSARVMSGTVGPPHVVAVHFW